MRPTTRLVTKAARGDGPTYPRNQRAAATPPEVLAVSALGWLSMAASARDSSRRGRNTSPSSRSTNATRETQATSHARLKKIFLTLAGLSSMLALAGAAQATPRRARNALVPLPASVGRGPVRTHRQARQAARQALHAGERAGAQGARTHAGPQADWPPGSQGSRRALARGATAGSTYLWTQPYYRQVQGRRGYGGP